MVYVCMFVDKIDEKGAYLALKQSRDPPSGLLMEMETGDLVQMYYLEKLDIILSIKGSLECSKSFMR